MLWGRNRYTDFLERKVQGFRRRLHAYLGLPPVAAPALEEPFYESRVKHNALFKQKVKGFKHKLQIGVRGQKIAPDWFALDLYDKSDLIDYNYDVQDLPFEDGRFDCIVCNAILEHVPEPELALFEMHRVLRPGGQIWVEAPFLQAYHAHPHDFWRCTLHGMRLWMEDFDEVASGIFEGFSNEATMLFDAFHRDLDVAPETVSGKRARLKSYIRTMEEKNAVSTSLYSATFYWGEKPVNRVVPEAKKLYMNHRKQCMRERGRPSPS
jgi:SAM-dependent methyltransferase